MPPKFIFLRHGEAEHNVAFHVEGNTVFSKLEYKDAPLTEKGIKQARDAAELLSTLTILDIWCSPLTRCMQTMEEVFEENDVNDIYLHDNLMERQGGGYVCNERKSKAEIKEKFPILKNEYIADLPAYWSTFENSYALRQRMFMLVMLLADLYKDEPETSHVLLVGHCDAIQTLIGKSLKNAEYVIMSLDEIINV